jgi:segregation and condensation protein B
MSQSSLSSVLEAVLLAAGRPVTVEQLLELFDDSQRPTADAVRAALIALGQNCGDRAFELREVASGWRLQVRPQFAEIVARLWQERPSRYSRALLETLALIAYRQPITRGEIEDIRGVTVSSTIMRTLQERNWIRVVGHREVPGRPELLGTTREFLDYFGLRSLDDLPTLVELRDLEDIRLQLELPEGGDGERPVAAMPVLANGELPATQAAPGSRDASSAEPAIVDEESGGDDDEAAADGEPDSTAAEPRSPTLAAAPDADRET